MRIRRRSAIVLASAAAFGVGFIAFPGSAAAAPPVVPACSFPNTSGSDSCDKLRVNPVSAPIGGALEPVGLGVRVRSRFSPPSSETTSIQLRFDDNIALNLSRIPSCPSAELNGKNIAQAYEQCGPGADGHPASEGNAYLSPAGSVSGYGSTTASGIVACTMVFKGADKNHLTLYARALAGSTNAPCNANPATNTAVGATVIFTGTLSRGGASSPYKWTLTVRNTQTANPALDDFSAFIRRGSAFRANCPAGQSPLRMKGIWDYTAAGDANDTFVSTRPCP
jgi:hypothetical protein